MAEWAVLTWQPVVWLTGALEESQVEVEDERNAAWVTLWVV